MPVICTFSTSYSSYRRAFVSARPFYSIALSAALLSWHAIIKRAFSTIVINSTFPKSVIHLFPYSFCPFRPPLTVHSQLRNHLFAPTTSHIPFLYRYIHHLSFTSLALFFPYIPQYFHWSGFLHSPATCSLPFICQLPFYLSIPFLSFHRFIKTAYNAAFFPSFTSPLYVSDSIFRL